jgi:hypothetical protein
MKASILGLLIAATSIAAIGAVAAPDSKAACLTSDLIGLGTNCVTFEDGLMATAKVVSTVPICKGTFLGSWEAAFQGVLRSR